MSTKISKGARLHLLRIVEKLQYPMRVIRMGATTLDPRKASEYLRSLKGFQAFTLPPGCAFEIVGHVDSP